jgi:hypothetical protein
MIHQCLDHKVLEENCPKISEEIPKNINNSKEKQRKESPITNFKTYYMWFW